jgi:hypothetical protein
MIKKLIGIVGTLGMLGGLGLTATAASAATSHDRGDHVRSYVVCSNPNHDGLITFLNQWGYQVTESSSNTAQYLTDAYRDRVEAGGYFAKHAVTVLEPAFTGGSTVCISVVYPGHRWDGDRWDRG